MKRIDLLKIIANGGATLDDSGRAVSYRRGYQVSKKDCYILNARHTNKIKGLYTPGKKDYTITDENGNAIALLQIDY